MRLLSVIHGPAFGGAHNQARCLNGPLRERGCETTVVLPSEAKAAATRLRAAGVEVVTLPLHRLRATSSVRVQAEFALGLRSEVRMLTELVEELEIDVVQSHGATNPHGAAAARKAGAASVWQLFDTRAPMALRRLAMPYVVRRADAMTTWGRELARVHPGAERLGDRLTVVYPPVEEPRFRPDPAKRAEARERLGIAEDAPLVGSVGVLNPQKGHEHTIRTADKVRRVHPAARFRILGASSPAHGAYERELRKEARRRNLDASLAFIDPGSEVDVLMQAFDLFLMTSVPRSEGMPTVILEAMTCGKPVVTTDVGAVRELVADGQTGMVVEPLDTDAIAAAVIQLLGDADRRRELGANGRRRAVGEFGLERLADLHASAYETALAHRASRG